MQTITSTENNQKIYRSTLNNGITVIAVENNTADVISGKIFLKNAGGRWDNPKQAGLSHLVSSVVTKGTNNLSSVEIAEKIETIGASLGADAATDYFLVTIKTVASDFAEMLRLAGEIMTNPSFPDTEIELEKYLTQQSIRSQQESPFNIAFNQLRKAMYGDHPYGFSILGTEETVSELTRADLQAYHQKFFRPDNFIISLSGRLSPDMAINMVEEVFGHWQPPTDPFPSLILPSLQSQPSETITPQDTQQSIVMLGYLTTGVKSEDYPVLKLINTYLGNGLSSRLFVELREKRGLAYDVSAFYPTRLENSQFVVYMGTAPENKAIAREGLKTEVDRLCDTKLSEEELQTGKNKLLGQYALGKQTNGEIAQMLGWYETLGLGIEFDDHFPTLIAQVTTEDIQRVAQKYLTQPYISIVGPS